jgi:hypothetical protein
MRERGTQAAQICKLLTRRVRCLSQLKKQSDFVEDKVGTREKDIGITAHEAATSGDGRGDPQSPREAESMRYFAAYEYEINKQLRWGLNWIKMIWRARRDRLPCDSWMRSMAVLY